LAAAPEWPGRGSQLPAASRPAGVIFLKHLKKIAKMEQLTALAPSLAVT